MITTVDSFIHCNGMVSSDTVCGNEAFKQGRFEKAVALWSFALEAHEANVAVILASRSAAYARLDCWPQALCDAEQVSLTC